LAPLDQPAPHDRVQSNLMERTVRDLNPRPPVTLPIGAALADAVAAMEREDVSTVLVVNDGGQLCGIFSERDLLRRVPETDARDGSRLLSEFMTREPESVAPDDKLAHALHKMDVGGYRHLPVVSNGMPVGILSVRDMVRHISGLCRE
jgi:CBS domain-containing protein